MRRMYENFDRRTRRYATSDIVVHLRAATEIDYKAFFERHIQGPTPPRSLVDEIPGQLVAFGRSVPSPNSARGASDESSIA
jgi:predicted metalloprotease with PDZ domain